MALTAANTAEASVYPKGQSQSAAQPLDVVISLSVRAGLPQSRRRQFFALGERRRARIPGMPQSAHVYFCIATLDRAAVVAVAFPRQNVLCNACFHEACTVEKGEESST